MIKNDEMNPIDLDTQPWVQLIKTDEDVNKELRLARAIGRISRSTNYLKDNFENDSQEDCNKFNEQWIKNKNHGSLGNHININFEFRNVSIKGAKLLEKPRIGVGYTEASTRYIYFNKEDGKPNYYVPHFLFYKEFTKTLNQYKLTIEKMLGKYYEMCDEFRKRIAERDGVSIDKIKDLKFLDSARYYIPVALQTHLGATYNITALKSLLEQLEKSETAEAKMLLLGIKSVLEQTDVIHIINLEEYFINDYSVHEVDPLSVFDQLNRIRKYIDAGSIILQDYDKHSVNVEVQASKFNNFIYSKDIEVILNDPKADGKDLETISVAFRGSVDYGAFRDIQRHRIATMIYHDLPGHDLSNVYYKSQLEQEFNINLSDYYYDLHKMRMKLFDTFVEDCKSLDNNEMYFATDYITEILSLATPLSKSFEFDCYTNLREVRHMINQRTKKDSHISYKTFFEMLKQGVAKELDKLPIRSTH